MIAVSYPKVKQLKPYIFVEPFAGSGALTYWLGGKPPISYCGSKQGYAHVIADILGLSQHYRPAGIILGEPGPFAAVHATLGGASGSAEDVAAMLTNGYLSYGQIAGGSFRATAGGGWPDDPPDVANLAPKVAELPMPASAAVANIIRSWKNEEPRALWERLKAKGWPSLLLPEGPRVQVKRADFRVFEPWFRPWPAPQTLVPVRGRWLGPQSVEDVANYVTKCKWSYEAGNPSTGFCGPGGRFEDTSVPAISRAVESLPTFPPLAVWQGVAEELVLPGDLTGFVILEDGPYHGDGSRKITGYKHGTCSRETQLRLARDWSARGAIVAVCESVRLDRELGEGWHAVNISHARKGQVRSFTRNQGDNRKEPEEWVTLNREPAYVPPKQLGMFS